jgi:predicted hotdog family 3-hydroxylacyl-ACP dehydratase
MEKSTTIDNPELPLPSEQLLPHRPSMLLVDSLVRRWDESSSAKAVLPTSGICLSRGRLLPEFFIELVAQAVAMANGYDALCAGIARSNGMLVGVDTFSFPGKAVAGSTVRIETEKTFEFGAVKIIHGEVFAGDELLAAGDIKVWEEPD